jgi:hypothetical protein
VSTGLLYYLSGLAILLGINLIAIWGLDLSSGWRASTTSPTSSSGR